MLFATQIHRESSRWASAWPQIFQPELIDLDFFNPEISTRKPFRGAYHINKRGAPIYILFFRIFWKVWGGIGSRVLFYYFAVLYLL